MDQIIIDITKDVIAVLLPFVSKAAEEFATQAGDTAYKKAELLWTTLHQKWSKDKEATKALTRFEQEPEQYKSTLEYFLQDRLPDDADLLASLRQILQSKQPTLDIHQHIMEEGKKITGVKAKAIKSGSINVSQDIKSAEEVVGVDITDLFG